MPRRPSPTQESPARRPSGPIRRFLQTAGPPLAIGLCVLALSVLAAGTLAAVVMGDELADTATDLIGDAGWFANQAGAWLGAAFEAG
ncbi:MAG: hypothetical protein AAGE65_08160 [Planctomycetota bacterium]